MAGGITGTSEKYVLHTARLANTPPGAHRLFYALGKRARTHQIRVFRDDDGGVVPGSGVHFVRPEQRRHVKLWRTVVVRIARAAVQVVFLVPPVLVVPHAEQHDEVLDQCQEHEQRARDQPHLDAFQFQRARRVVPAVSVQKRVIMFYVILRDNNK